MSEKRFQKTRIVDKWGGIYDSQTDRILDVNDVEHKLNEQQELIEELQVSDEMGWKRAEMFEKKCPKALHNKKMYIKRLEYKVQKFKERNGEQQVTIEQLERKLELKTEEVEYLKRMMVKWGMVKDE